jgi:hypothetical protein
MKADWRALPLALGLAALPASLRSQPAAAPAPAADAASDLRKELTQLVVADANQRAKAAPAQAPASAAGGPGVILLDPYVVRDNPAPVAPLPHYETPLTKFLKTGDIAHLELKKIPLKIAAPVEREAHGFAKPTIQFNLSW